MAEWAMVHPWMTFILGCTAFWSVSNIASSIAKAVALIVLDRSEEKKKLPGKDEI